MAASIYDDNFNQGQSSVEGMSTQGFIPVVRVRIKDLFSKNVNAVQGNHGTQLILPSFTLDPNLKGAGDNALLSISVERQMGVSASNSATLVFSNRDGSLYRGVIQKAVKPKLPGLSFGAQDALERLLPTVEEETQQTPPNADEILTVPIAQYLRKVIQSKQINADIAKDRAQLIQDLRQALRMLPVLSVDDPISVIPSNTRDMLVRLLRVEMNFDQMAPIEIDMQDVKGRWFGIFTGFVSSVDDDVTPGELPTATIHCMDKMAFFMRAFAVLQASLLPKAVLQTNSEAGQVDAKSSILSGVLDGQLMWQVFMLLIRVVNSTFTAQGYYESALVTGAANTDSVGALTKFTDEQYKTMFSSWVRAGVAPDKATPEDAIYKGNLLDPLQQSPRTRFWYFFPTLLSPDLQADGRSTHVRLFRLWTFPNVAGKATSVGPTKILAVGDAALSEKSTVMGLPNYQSFDDYRGLCNYWPFQTMGQGQWGSIGERVKFPNAHLPGAKGDLATPFRDIGLAVFDRVFKQQDNSALPDDVGRFASAMLRTTWIQFMNNSAPAGDKLANVEQATFTNIYTTGLGDIVFALPRWNQVPLPDVESIEAGPDYMVATGGLDPTQAQDIGMDRRDFYHGKEYVMSDFGLVNRKITQTEEGKVDKVLVPGVVDFLGSVFPADILGAEGTPLGGSIGNSQFQALFGDRVFQVQQAFPLNTALGDMHILLKHFASCVQTMLSIRPNTLDVTYRIPRPLELGKNVFLPDNCQLYYITTITRAWHVGSEYTESYHCEYGHPLWFQVPIPWITRANDIINSTKDRQASITPTQ